MRSYFALQGRCTYAGGWTAVLSWAREVIREDSTPVKIIAARPGERNGRIVAEITPDGLRIIDHGRQVSIRSLRGKT